MKADTTPMADIPARSAHEIRIYAMNASLTLREQASLVTAAAESLRCFDGLILQKFFLEPNSRRWIQHLVWELGYEPALEATFTHAEAHAILASLGHLLPIETVLQEG